MKYFFLFSLLINYIYSYNTISSLIPNNNNNFNNFKSRRNLLYKSIGGISLFELININKVNAYTITNYKNNNVDNILYYIEQEQEKIFNNSLQTVCYISTEYNSIADKFNLNKEDLPKGVGTGFIWDKKGHIITNFHVINKVDNAFVTITTHNNKKITYNAKLTGVDPDTDLAVLKIDAPPEYLKIINYNKDVKTRVGQFAFAIGNPFGQDHTITSGIISANNREISAPTGRKIYNIIQTDAAINPGNSGGPLLNSKGELIGINTASLGAGVSSGIGFTIPIQNAFNSITEIIDTGFVQKAIIGISYMERNPTELESEKSGIPIIKKGILILEVPKNSPAEFANLKGIRFNNETKKVEKLGDIIIQINNNIVNNQNDLNNILKKYKPDDIVDIKYIRDNKEEKTKLKLGKYKGTAFTKLENEKKIDDDIKKIDIPLKDLEPVIQPKLN